MYITKGRLWDILGTKAISFAGWLNSADPYAAPMKYMLENTDGITLDGKLVSQQLIPLLLSKGIIDQEVIDRINVILEDDKRKTQVYIVPKPEGVTDYNTWVKERCSAAFTLQITDDNLYITTKGIFKP